MRRRAGARRDGGALLLEIMLALAIFAMAGMAILTLVDRTIGSMEHARVVEQAADLARSAMAKMEAGIETARTLNGPVRAWTPPEGDGEVKGGGVVEAAGLESLWELKVDTEPSQFTGLTRVSVTAVKHAAPGSDRLEASYTLRQLVRLSGKGEDKVGSEDALAEEARRGLRSQEGLRLGTPGATGAAGGER